MTTPGGSPVNNPFTPWHMVLARLEKRRRRAEKRRQYRARGRAKQQKGDAQ